MQDRIQVRYCQDAVTMRMEIGEKEEGPEEDDGRWSLLVKMEDGDITPTCTIDEILPQTCAA